MFKVTRRTFLAGSTALAAAGLAPMRAMASAPKTYRALLVACTDYPNLPQKNWLVGPKNDAALVREYLLRHTPDGVQFAPENVTVLATEVEGANGQPTHEAIKAALADIAAKAERDDFIYLHLSGHGAQQPQMREGDETDGLDEIFLPSNVDKWTDRSKGVPNALVDNEIGEAIDAIRSKGAFVWAIFDCCHSGTATRDVTEVDSQWERKVEFSELVDERAREEGMKEYAGAQAQADAAAARAIEEDANARLPAFNLSPTGAESIARGGLVAFYAAQTIETTPEMPLPKGAENPERLGLFTFTVFSKLAENPNVTYRQLGQAVLQQYSADGRTRPTPLFEGSLDARVFGTEGTAVLQWPIVVKGTSATIAGGLLHRLTPGTKLAIVPSALSNLSDAIGYLEVQSAQNLESRVKPVVYADKPALPLSEIPPGSMARVAELAVDYKLAVARPAPSAGLEAEVAFVNSVLDELDASTGKLFNIALVEPGQSADIRLAVLRENAIENASARASDQPALWFLPASGDVTLKDGSRPPLVIVHQDDREKFAKNVGDNLTTIFRATSLSRLAAASDYKPDQVSVEFQIKRQSDGSTEPLVAAAVPRVFPGDEVHVVARNQSNKLVDINVLYVGSDYSITHIVAERLAGGATLEEGLLAFTDSSFGMERMIAVLTDAPPQSEMEDLSFLAQGGVPQARRALGDAAVGFADMLRDVGLGPSTRSAMKLGDQGGSKGAVMIFPVETVRPAT